ncbi:unnamed protein product, partial [Pylaiella littoralis]
MAVRLMSRLLLQLPILLVAASAVEDETVESAQSSPSTPSGASIWYAEETPDMGSGGGDDRDDDDEDSSGPATVILLSVLGGLLAVTAVAGLYWCYLRANDGKCSTPRSGRSNSHGNKKNRVLRGGRSRNGRGGVGPGQGPAGQPGRDRSFPRTFMQTTADASAWATVEDGGEDGGMDQHINGTNPMLPKQRYRDLTYFKSAKVATSGSAKGEGTVATKISRTKRGGSNVSDGARGNVRSGVRGRLAGGSEGTRSHHQRGASSPLSRLRLAARESEPVAPRSSSRSAAVSPGGCTDRTRNGRTRRGSFDGGSVSGSAGGSVTSDIPGRVAGEGKETRSHHQRGASPPLSRLWLADPESESVASRSTSRSAAARTKGRTKRTSNGSSVGGSASDGSISGSAGGSVRSGTPGKLPKESEGIRGHREGGASPPLSRLWLADPESESVASRSTSRSATSRTKGRTDRTSNGSARDGRNGSSSGNAVTSGVSTRRTLSRGPSWSSQGSGSSQSTPDLLCSLGSEFLTGSSAAPVEQEQSGRGGSREPSLRPAASAAIATGDEDVASRRKAAGFSHTSRRHNSRRLRSLLAPTTAASVSPRTDHASYRNSDPRTSPFSPTRPPSRDKNLQGPQSSGGSRPHNLRP